MGLNMVFGGLWLSFNARSHKITMFVSKKIDFISKSGVTEPKEPKHENKRAIPRAIYTVLLIFRR